jgi:hypothetical protein
MARALGAEVTLITTLEPDFPAGLLDGLDVRATPGAVARYENRYDALGNRTQRLLAPGSDLRLVPHLAPGESFDLVFYAPAYHEFRKAPLRFQGALVGVSLQGALRTTDEEGRVIPHPRPLEAARALVRPGWCAFLSEEDTAAPEALAAVLAAERTLVVLTRGYNGATLFELDGSSTSYPAVPAEATEPTGAGDCFAMAFMVRLAETDSVDQAMRFALAAGALAVEAPGLAGIASRAAIEERMTREAA